MKGKRKSCMTCIYGVELIIDDVKECANKKSEYFGEVVDDRDICIEIKEFKSCDNCKHNSDYFDCIQCNGKDEWEMIE